MRPLITCHVVVIQSISVICQWLRHNLNIVRVHAWVFQCQSKVARICHWNFISHCGLNCYGVLCLVSRCQEQVLQVFKSKSETCRIVVKVYCSGASWIFNGVSVLNVTPSGLSHERWDLIQISHVCDRVLLIDKFGSNQALGFVAWVDDSDHEGLG